MTGSIVEKAYFAVWNAIQNVLLTLKPNIYCFCLIIYVIFPYPSNKRINYGLQLNLISTVKPPNSGHPK